MPLPDYQGGSLVNLMSSLRLALGDKTSLYPPLRKLDPSGLRGSRNLVLMVIDGLGYEYLTRAGRDTTLNHYLRARITSVFPSTTSTAITTFLTGVAPQQHALTGWHIYFEELGSIMAVLPFRPRQGGPIPRAASLDTSPLFDYMPVFNRIRRRSYAIVPARIIDSRFNAAYCTAASKRPYTTLEKFFKTVTRVVREDDEGKYIYAYYPELDRLTHDHGLSSPEVSSHLLELDAAFGRFLNHIEGSHTTVIVTADHGFIDSPMDRHIELEDHPLLAETLLRPLCGESRITYCYVRPEKRGQFERYVHTELAAQVTLFPSEELIEQGYFGLGLCHPRLKQRIGDYTLVLRDNYVIKDWLPGEKRYRHIGVHGGLSAEEMHVPLIVVTT